MGRLTDEELKSLDIYENENDIWIGKEHHIFIQNLQVLKVGKLPLN